MCPGDGIPLGFIEVDKVGLRYIQTRFRYTRVERMVLAAQKRLTQMLREVMGTAALIHIFQLRSPSITKKQTSPSIKVEFRRTRLDFDSFEKFYLGKVQ